MNKKIIAFFLNSFIAATTVASPALAITPEQREEAIIDSFQTASLAVILCKQKLPKISPETWGYQDFYESCYTITHYYKDFLEETVNAESDRDFLYSLIRLDNLWKAVGLSWETIQTLNPDL